MILYHGSTVPVEKPEIRISESFLDFGTGFLYHDVLAAGGALGKNQDA